MCWTLCTSFWPIHLGMLFDIRSPSDERVKNLVVNVEYWEILDVGVLEWIPEGLQLARAYRTKGNRSIDLKPDDHFVEELSDRYGAIIRCDGALFKKVAGLKETIRVRALRGTRYRLTIGSDHGPRGEAARDSDFEKRARLS